MQLCKAKGHLFILGTRDTLFKICMLPHTSWDTQIFLLTPNDQNTPNTSFPLLFQILNWITNFEVTYIVFNKSNHILDVMKATGNKVQN